jgi:DNA-binding beta-propeller fold protein YncE
LSGEDLYVANDGEGTVGKYNVNTGKAIDASFIKGFPKDKIFGLGVSGDNLYVAVYSENELQKYSTTSGRLLWFVSISAPYGVAFLPGIVFVGDTALGIIGEYKATTGHVINANFITGLNKPFQIATLGDKLFVTN